MTRRRRIIDVFMLLMMACAVSAQTVSGVVKDRQTKRPVSHVSVSVAKGTVQTVTNEDGRFTLKLSKPAASILLSHIGYKTRNYSLEGASDKDIEIMLMPKTIQLSEVVVSADDPEAILYAAMNRIERNYPQQPELMRCFYRETSRKGSRFIAVAEAVLQMYKSSYAYGPKYDAVAIEKGRRLMSMKARDTLSVKVKGGPVLPLMVDVAKNSDYILNEEQLRACDLHMELPVMIGERLHHVIRIEPRPITLFPMMGGKLYVDQQSLTITRAELQLDVRDWRKASDYMLVKKPVGLRFRPKELSMTVVYQTDEQGVTRMAYVRNEMRFHCDWKRRLFASPYTMTCEMVVTDRLGQGRDIQRPRGRSAFGSHDLFYDQVEYFDDPDFWADYNIIEPTESLEHAIDKLKKKVRTKQNK